MTVEFEEYRALLGRLVDLQRKLVQVFETNVQIVPLLPGFPDELRSQLEGVIKPDHSITQIPHEWPIDVAVIPLFTWVKPEKGVVQLEGQTWLFQIHGALQVSFIELPIGLDTDIMDQLKSGKVDILIGSEVQAGLVVEVEYLQGGRTGGVNSWTAWLFASSYLPSMRNLSQEDHVHLLDELAVEGFLVPWPYPRAQTERYFVLAEEEKPLGGGQPTLA